MGKFLWNLDLRGETTFLASIYEEKTVIYIYKEKTVIYMVMSFLFYGS